MHTIRLLPFKLVTIVVLAVATLMVLQTTKADGTNTATVTEIKRNHLKNNDWVDLEVFHSLGVKASVEVHVKNEISGNVDYSRTLKPGEKFFIHPQVLPGQPVSYTTTVTPVNY